MGIPVLSVTNDVEAMLIRFVNGLKLQGDNTLCTSDKENNSRWYRTPTLF